MEKKTYNIKTEALEVIGEGGRVIRGLIYRPDVECTFPAVIFSHGFGSNYRELMHHGNGYAESGIVCVFFDFCGGGVESTSDGTMQEMTVMTEAEDLVSVIGYIKSLSYVESDSLYLHGESQGGFVSAIVGKLHQEEIRALILWYPAFVIPDDSKRRLDKGDNTAMGISLSPDYNKVAVQIDVQELQTGFEKPVLLIHGNKDDIVPIEYSRNAAANYRFSSFEEIDGAGHGFDGKDSNWAREASIAFVKANESAYIADGARVIGDVRIGKDSAVWYNAVVRGDSCPIVIGDRTNIQDLACLHVDKQFNLRIGSDVTIGHGAIVHGCIVGDNVLIGMGAIIMNGARIGNNCIIGAGALVTEKTEVPDGSMVYGSPAKVIRQLSEDEIAGITQNARLYVEHALKEKMR